MSKGNDKGITRLYPKEGTGVPPSPAQHAVAERPWSWAWRSPDHPSGLWRGHAGASVKASWEPWELQVLLLATLRTRARFAASTHSNWPVASPFPGPNTASPRGVTQNPVSGDTAKSPGRQRAEGKCSLAA